MSITLFLHLFRSLYVIFVKTNFLGMMLEINTFILGKDTIKKSSSFDY